MSAPAPPTDTYDEEWELLASDYRAVYHPLVAAILAHNRLVIRRRAAAKRSLGQ